MRPYNGRTLPFVLLGEAGVWREQKYVLLSEKVAEPSDSILGVLDELVLGLVADVLRRRV